MIIVWNRFKHLILLRFSHIRLADSVALEVAIEEEDAGLAPARIRKKALELVRVILKERLQHNAGKLVDILLDEGVR